MIHNLRLGNPGRIALAPRNFVTCRLALVKVAETSLKGIRSNPAMIDETGENLSWCATQKDFETERVNQTKRVTANISIQVETTP